MTDRIHSHLDGDTPVPALTASELAELEELQQALTDAQSWVYSAPVPSFSARVMAALPEVPPARPATAARLTDLLRQLGRWFWLPREVSIRPAYAFPAVLVLLLGLPLISGDRDAAGDEIALAADGAAPSERLYVQFRLDAPGASRVAIAGSFTEWEPRVELDEVAPGVWTANVPLPAGVHDYLFVVDGDQWVPDPVARPVEDGFGGMNSRLFLGTGEFQT